MNIPLDNLYHWIRGLASQPVSIYTFRPYGSKNITDLDLLSQRDIISVAPELVCHDQEPLDYSRCANLHLQDLWNSTQHRSNPSKFAAEINDLDSHYFDLDFYTVLRSLKPKSIFDRYILLHSEKNSRDVEQFSRNSEPVYYWSHGIIARDWYRFAEHDSRLQRSSGCKKPFLVYCRAWTGTREYRLKFLDILIDKNLIDYCQTSVLHQDQGVDLDSYVCNKLEFQPKNTKLLTQIVNNSQPAHASADYCAEDFVSTDISIVLETIADNSKIHLTEKTLRPIACGHPFMLVAGPGALKYLKSYGFKTFAPWIDESYDLEQDTIKRMEMISTEMHRINCLGPEQKQHLLEQLKQVAVYNKNHFFSKEFFDQIQQELVENLNQAIQRVKITRGRYFLLSKKIIKKHRRLQNRQLNYTISSILRKLRQDPTQDLGQLISQSPVDLFND